MLTLGILVAILISIKPLYMGISFGIKYFIFQREKIRLKNQLNKYQVEKDIQESEKKVKDKVGKATDKEIIDYFNK